MTFPKKRNSGNPNFEEEKVIVTPDLCSYLQTVSLIPNDEFDEDYSLRLVDECKGFEEILLIRSDTSRSLEEICTKHKATALPILKTILDLKKKKVISLMTHRNGSRTLEAMLKVCLGDVLEQIMPIINEEWTTLCLDQYASHIIRTMAICMCGLKKEAFDEMNSSNSRKIAKVEPQFKPHLEMILSRALAWNLVKDLVFDEACSMLTQDLIVVDSITGGKHLQLMLDAIYEDKNGQSSVVDQISNKQASRVWDKIFQRVTEDQFETLFSVAISGQMATLAMHHFANFTVQNIVTRCNNDEMATNAFDELLPILPDLLSGKREGVVTAMLKVASPLKAARKSLIKGLLKFVDCYRPEERRTKFGLCLLCLCSFDTINDESQHISTRITYHGTHFAQCLLNYFKGGCKKLVDSILSLDSQMLANFACHQSASHVLDAFFISNKVEESDKEALFQKIGAEWVSISCDKYGSRVVDTVWKVLSMKHKCALAKCLHNQLQILLRNQFGRIIAKKYSIEDYSKKSENKWRNILTEQMKKQERNTNLKRKMNTWPQNEMNIKVKKEEISN